MTTDDTLRPRAIRLFEYLQAVRALREQPVRDIADYQDRRWWAADIPSHPSCAITPSGEEPWLSVSKATVPGMPAVPADLAPYLTGPPTDPQREPSLVDDLEDRLVDQPGRANQVRAALKAYKDRLWLPWAEQASIALAARKLYEDFYDLRLRLQREEAFIELVWGHGVLSWLVNGERVLHPMATTRVQLSFDADSGDIRVMPDALVGHLEIDLLQGLGLGGFDLLVDIRDRFRTDPIGPFDPAARTLYQQLLQPLGLDGAIVDDSRPSPPANTPTIAATWGLFVRRRSTLYQRFFGSLRDALADGTVPVPAPLGAVVADEPSRLDGEGGGGDDGAWKAVGERLLMPLPTNPEQEQVAVRLSQHRGVTVQGPPGTGKTHSIANLVSHLVGHGKRVLVTSQKEQALSVLREKIPESIRDLSVAVLGSSATSLSQLDQSVQAIYERAVALDCKTARQELGSLECELDAAQREVAELRSRIQRTVARERDSYAVGTIKHTPSTLGQWLAGAESKLGFVPDEVAPDTACPLGPAEIVDLYRLASELEQADCEQARLELPRTRRRPSGSDLATSSAELRALRDRLADADSSVGDWDTIEQLGSEGLRTLTEVTERAVARLSILETPWLATVRRELRTPAFAGTWRDHVKALREGIEELAAWRTSLAGHRVVLPATGLPSKELLEALEVLRQRLADNRGVSKLRQRDLYRLREELRVDEEEPRTAADVELCITEARSRRRRYELVNRWNTEVGRIEGPLIEDAAAHPEYELESLTRSIDDALAWEDGSWSDLCEQLVANGITVPGHPSAEELAATAATLRVASNHFRRRELEEQLRLVRRLLVEGAADNNASVHWKLLLDQFDGQHWAAWEATLEDVRRVRALRDDVERLDALAKNLAEYAPAWSNRILDTRGDEGACGPAALGSQAWEWRQAQTWLHGIISGDDPAALQRQLETRSRIAAKLTGELASASAWLAVGERLTDAERQALTAWAQALKKVGKGTGKYAQKWRAVAQQSMEKAQSAVPVWIMPTYRVVESFDPANAMFDVVIVDESSQCDVFALAALGIAHKAVVVGDDKQISPQAVGTDQDKVHELITQHISDLPHSELLDITSSLYDIAKRTFPGVIMLREHFRCLPEIIDFSNQLSYGGAILPLREQLTDPAWTAVVDVPIPDGYREVGSDTNPPEAEFIVAKIAELCADPKYAGKTFGVISLLGISQAALIEGQLRDALGEREVERRRIRCGNAYHFQGDERDVMFISLVVAAGEGRRIGAMTKEADRQRMNVAASRARDQMWCVRSVTPDELHPDDVRGRFIRYCQNPQRVEETMGDLADKCDSDFERDVLRHLLARGYNVKVQHRVGRFRIDLVVESRRGRLAVELDGDAYHGPDRWEADRNRQAILERLGWSFYRIRGSAYFRDPDGSLTGLWERLDSAGIRPGDDPEPPPAAYPPDAIGTASTPDDRASSPWRGEPTMPTGSSGSTVTMDTVGADFEDAGELPTAAHSSLWLEEDGEHVVLSVSSPDEASSGSVQNGAEAALSIEPGLLERSAATVLKGLSPYRQWAAGPLPDARTAKACEIVDGLVGIVTTEGPVVASRAYEVYVRASGGHRVAKGVRSALNRAAASAIRAGRLCQLEDGEPGQAGKTLYMPGTPSVIVRARGDRDLEQIPITEVAALVRDLLDQHPRSEDADLKRQILRVYDRVRLTANASEFLDRGIRLARS